MRAFFLPAILGDDANLAEFRQNLKGRMDFDVIDLPDIDAPAALLSSMNKTAEVVVDEIVRRQPVGAIALTGYSFGASLALEVAAQLTRRQRTVSFLGVLDGAFTTKELKRSKSELLRLCLSAKGIASLALHLFERLNNRRRLIAANRAISSTVAHSPGIRKALLMDLRCEALNSWQPPACSVSGLIVFSGALGARNRSRWVSLCPNLTILNIAARHGDFLRGHSLEPIVQALAERSNSS